MTKLEDLKRGATVKGILPDCLVTVVDVKWVRRCRTDVQRPFWRAQRINLAHLFDPLLAIHPSMVDALPHQITAVYGEMLPRQPLRFLLADDPDARINAVSL
jgi:hypothetical protein